MRLIDEQFLETPSCGSRQMARHLQRHGYAVGRKRVRRLMAKIGVQAVYKKPKASQPHPEHRIWPYLLPKNGYRPPEPNLVRRHHVYPDAARFPVSGGSHGLGEAEGPVLACIEHAARRFFASKPWKTPWPATQHPRSSTSTRTPSSPPRASPACCWTPRSGSA